MGKNVCLVIVDGFGISEQSTGNATLGANFINSCRRERECTELYAHGEFVGLPDGMMGNSEVGHLTIGAGRTVMQSLNLINEKYRSGELKKTVARLSLSNRVHLVGMVSDGGIHSHLDHLRFLLECIPASCDAFIHAIADGIDTQPKTFCDFIKPFKNVVSITGRYFAMDRDGNWDRTERVVEMLTSFGSPSTVEEATQGTEDEFIRPMLIRTEGIKSDDTVIMFNFRADRMKQLYSKIRMICKTYTLTEYYDRDPNAIIQKQTVTNTLSEWISLNGKTQAHIAETEKYAHVTYFFNGGWEIKSAGEDWHALPSPRVQSFADSPETAMCAVSEKCIECIRDSYNFIVLNLAAPDLVGHTGDFDKTVMAVNKMDSLVWEIHRECQKHNYALIVTADHGNSEQMVRNGTVCKSHTTNKVVCIVLNSGLKMTKISNASLRNVAPTVLSIMGISKPPEMDAESLVE